MPLIDTLADALRHPPAAAGPGQLRAPGRRLRQPVPAAAGQRAAACRSWPPAARRCGWRPRRCGRCRRWTLPPPAVTAPGRGRPVRRGRGCSPSGPPPPRRASPWAPRNCAGGGRGLPGAGRAAAGHRAGRGAGPGAVRGPDRGPAERPVPAADQRRPDRAAAAPDAARHHRLEPRPAAQSRAGAAAAAVGVRQLVAGDGRAGLRRRAAARRARSSTCWRAWPTSRWSRSSPTSSARPGTGCWRPSASTPPPGWTTPARITRSARRLRDYTLKVAEHAMNVGHGAGPGPVVGPGGCVPALRRRRRQRARGAGLVPG